MSGETKPPVERTMFTVDEVAARWGLDRKTVYEDIKAGRILVVRFGARGIIRIPRSVVDSIEQGRVVPPGGHHGGAT